MSCWVVPTIAAELWGIPVQQVMDSLIAGHIPSKTESGFTFVDVAPDSPKLETPKKLRPATPPTYTTVVTSEEIAALTGAEVAAIDEDSMEEESDEGTIDLSNWREMRESSQRARRRPMAA